jgi:hypothetical protein
MSNATAQLKSSITTSELLDVVKKMNATEFMEFVKKVNSINLKRQKSLLSAKELELLGIIEKKLDKQTAKRLDVLQALATKRQLDLEEEQELLSIIDQIDELNIMRAQAVEELANLKRMSPKAVMQFFNIATLPNV